MADIATISNISTRKFKGVMIALMRRTLDSVELAGELICRFLSEEPARRIFR